MQTHLIYKRVVLGMILFSVSSNLFSQSKSAEIRQKILADEKVSAVIVSEQRQSPALISLKADKSSYSKNEIKPVLDRYLGVRTGIDKTVMDKETETNGKEVQEFQQYFKGIKVDRAKFKVMFKKGRAEILNGAWYNVPVSLSTTPAITKAQALTYAKDVVNATAYMPELIAEKIKNAKDVRVKTSLQKELQEVDYGGNLVIIQDFNQNDRTDMRLAYKFNVYAAQPLSRSWVYVDANSGEILLVDAIIKHVNESPQGVASVPTSVQTRYSGTRNINVKQISGLDPQSGLPITSSNPLEIYIPGSSTYALIDDTRGNGVETYDLNGVGGIPLNVAALYSQGKSFTDVDNRWSLAEHKRGAAVESENDDFAWDAHWGAGVVYDYWKVNQNRLSFDGNNAKIKSFIHSGLAFDNAFWNGTVMTYGDGSGTAANGFKPLTSLDVCGHEIGHGVCEFTADLVYAKESGAMNEGYSDIWAACVEYFAIKTVDPSLSSVYRPFYIGEQISASPDAPLRRMDNPKASGDPDTYGGQFWKTQDCSPSLANDQCGVHSNSGVLNKWFYLLAVGSGAGSGPDAIFAGEDDGINDAVLTGPLELQHSANAYQVTGLGFTQAERLAYLTELLLTTTATFHEARAVSIAVATDLSGNPCSAMVESVTNAWYAVGVGAKFVKPCTITYGFVVNNGSSVNESATPGGCVSSKTINIGVVLPPNSTASFAVSGTASALDYTLASTSLSNPTASIAKKDLVVTILNDAVVEGDEFVQVNATVSQVGSNPVNKSYKLTILDDDVVPVIGSNQRTLLTETFTRTDGFADPAGWTEILEVPEAPNGDAVAAGKNQWGIFDNALAITGKEGMTGTTFPNGTYNNNSPSQTIIKSPLLDARGLSVVTIKFDFTIQGELDVTAATDDPENLPVFDYMAVAYSLDGINFIELNGGDFRQYAFNTPTSGTITGILPASLANKQFYIAFRWFNDTNAGGPVGASVDNVTVTAAPRTIENDLNHGGRETLAPAQEVYFYSSQDGQVVANLKNGSAKTFGCANVYVEKTGTGTFNLFQNSQGLHKVSDKIVRVETAISMKASTTVTLYFTEAQLQGLENASGQSRTAFSAYHVQDLAFSAATSSNTKRYSPTFTALPGVGGSYTFTHTERANGSYAIGVLASVFAKTAEPSSTITASEMSFENVSPNPLQGDGFINVSAPSASRLRMDVVNEIRQNIFSRTVTIPQGVTRITIPGNLLKKGRYSVTISNEQGVIVNSQSFIKQ